MFYILSELEIHFSAIDYRLDRPHTVSGCRLQNTFHTFNLFPNKPWFLRVCSKRLLKTLREKEKLLVTSNFSFSHSVFYPF